MYNTLLKMTQRNIIPCFYLFIYFLMDVNARSLVLKNDKLPVQQKDKEIHFPLSHSTSLTNGQHGKHDSTPFRVLIGSQSGITEVFQQSLSAKNNKVLSKTERRCKRTTTKRRRRRYLVHGSKIMKYDIKWTIDVQSTKLTFSEQKFVLDKAFRTWATKCSLAFIYTTNTSEADIVIKFVTGNHGDVEKFDDAGPIKAHGFFPSSGSEIHFDDYEKWVTDPNGKGGISLLTVAVHEIGHSLGLRHSSTPSAVMYPVLHQGKNTLDTDDILGIRQIYGDCTVQKVDAVLTRKDGLRDTAFVFKNEWVWEVQLSTKQIKTGFPKKISEHFNTVLAGKQTFKSIFYERKYKTFLFMFNTGYTILDDYPHYPAQLKNMPYTSLYSYFTFLQNPPDAAFVDPHDSDMYHFFIGSQYYKYDMSTFQLENGYPKSITSQWPGVPNDIDTAYYNFEKSAYYFIKGNEYFILDSADGTYYPEGVLTDLFQNICPI